jgi:hypothetical protein
MKKDDIKGYIALSIFWLVFNGFFIWVTINEIIKVGITAGIWLLLFIPLTILNLYVLISAIKELKKSREQT